MPTIVEKIPPSKEMSADMVDSLMAALNQAKQKNQAVKDVSIVYEGTQIILPEINGIPMDFDTAIEWLMRKRDQDNQEMDVYHEFAGAPLDGAVAFHRALKEIYGWTQMTTAIEMGFMGPEKRPPVLIGVPISATETIQVALGQVEIPGITGHLDVQISIRNGIPKFVIGGNVRKKHENHVQKIVDVTRRLLKEESIYRGAALKISWAWETDGRKYDPIKDAPQFMELSGVSEDDLIFGDKVMSDLKIGLFTPIEQAAACRENHIPLKRGVLLYGPYGTGKTMTAYVSASKAVRHGWTFVYLDRVTDLKKALDFAAKYAPCVLFAEDIDRMMDGARDIDMDDILNTLDGVDTKGAEIITVFTTNHIENINPATLRMGRLDTLVHVTPPDAKAVEKLIQLYSRGLLDPKADLKKVGEALEGQIPAFIREVTERAKIAAIARLGNAGIKGHVLGDDLVNAAKAMEVHADLLKPQAAKLVDPKHYSVLIPGTQLESIGEDVKNIHSLLN